MIANEEQDRGIADRSFASDEEQGEMLEDLRLTASPVWKDYTSYLLPQGRGSLY